MSLWRKRPVVVEAVQWWPDRAPHPSVTRYPNIDGPGCPHCDGSPPGDHGRVETLEGAHDVCPGDWIITGIKGEHYPCKPDIFEATYEPAGDDGGTP